MHRDSSGNGAGLRRRLVSGPPLPELGIGASAWRRRGLHGDWAAATLCSICVAAAATGVITGSTAADTTEEAAAVAEKLDGGR